MKRIKITQEIAEDRVLEKCKEKNYELIEPFLYENVKTKIHLICNKDNNKWFITYSNFIHKNRGCTKCNGGIKLLDEIVMIKIKNKCNEKKYVLLNENFIYCGVNKTRLHLKCDICNHEWNCLYNSLINKNSSCPKCSGKLKLTQEEVEKAILKKCEENNYILDKSIVYKNNISRLYLKCNVCNHKWNCSYSSFIYRNSNCPNCYGNAKISQKNAELNVYSRCNEKKCKLNNIFTYKNNKSKLHLKCDICNHEWDCSYSNFIYSNNNCPECGKERAINTIIKKYGEVWLKHVPRYNPNSIIYLDLISEKLGIKIQHALNGGEKKFIRYWVDGFIEEYNICIEWNEYIHYHSKKYKEKDIIKKQFLEDNFNCKIIFINECKFLEDIDNEIDVVINEIKNFIK